MAEGISIEQPRSPLARKQKIRVLQKRAQERKTKEVTAQQQKTPSPSRHEGIMLPTGATAIGGSITAALTALTRGDTQPPPQPVPISEYQSDSQKARTEIVNRHIPSPLDLVTYESNTSEHEEALKKINKQAKILKFDINDKVTPHYERSLAVVKKHRELITRMALEYGIDPEIALALVMVENGGGEFEVNDSSGAKGMWQLKKGAAIDMGLTVSDDPKEIDPIKDERMDPEKATNAALGYLRHQIDYFGDYRWGIASYHTGVTNICDFIYQYEKARNRHQTLPKPDIEEGVTQKEITIFADRIHMHHLSPHAVLPTMKEYISNSSYLDLDSLIYNYTVGGARKLLEEDNVIPKEISLNMPETPPSYPKPRSDGAVV